MTRRRPVPASARRPRGASLLELMVSIAVGLILVAGLLVIYLNAYQTSSKLSDMNRQIENGRFALQLLRDDLMHAGFWGELTPPTTPTALPDPCAAYSGWDAAYLNNFLSIAIQGYDDGSGLPSTCTLVANRQGGTDILVLRHANSCIADASNCEATTSGKLYFQASLCSNDASTYQLSTDPSVFTLRKNYTNGSTVRTCASSGYVSTLADKRKAISNLYYVRNYAVTEGDGIPTLMRSELDLASGVVKHQSAQPLVEGIESLQIEYGLDTNGDGNVDSYSSTPADASAWSNVVAVKVHVLARNLTTTSGHTDVKTYAVGPVTLGPFDDAYQRHAYSAHVRLNNPAGRR